MRFEKPHSLSYHAENADHVAVQNLGLVKVAKIDERGSWLKVGRLTSLAGQCTPKDALERARGCSGCNDGGVDFFDCCGARGASNVRSTTETFGVGHADSDAVELAVEFWQDTRPTALAAPVEVGIMDQCRRTCAVEVFVHGIQRWLVASVAVDGGHEAALVMPTVHRSGPWQQGDRQLVVQDALERMRSSAL